jgi:hypothetical protein
LGVGTGRRAGILCENWGHARHVDGLAVKWGWVGAWNTVMSRESRR